MRRLIWAGGMANSEWICLSKMYTTSSLKGIGKSSKRRRSRRASAKTLKLVGGVAWRSVNSGLTTVATMSAAQKPADDVKVGRIVNRRMCHNYLNL